MDFTHNVHKHIHLICIHMRERHTDTHRDRIYQELAWAHSKLKALFLFISLYLMIKIIHNPAKQCPNSGSNVQTHEPVGNILHSNHNNYFREEFTLTLVLWFDSQVLKSVPCVSQDCVQKRIYSLSRSFFSSPRTMGVPTGL